MGSIWIRLDSVTNDEIYGRMVTPLLASLRAHGIEVNDEPTKNLIFQNEGELTFDIVAGGNVSIVFTTGPHRGLMGDIDDSRYFMAIVPGKVSEALRDYHARLIEDEIYEAPRISD